MRNPANNTYSGQDASGQDSAKLANIQFELTPVDNQRLANLCGPVNKHLQQIEDFYDVKISCRSNQFEISGEKCGADII